MKIPVAYLFALSALPAAAAFASAPDVAGIEVGMSREQAVSVLRAHVPELNVRIPKGDFGSELRGDPKSQDYSLQKDTFILSLFGPAGGKVAAVMREVHQPHKQDLLREQLLISLKAKYGESFEELPNFEGWRWFFGPDGRTVPKPAAANQKDQCRVSVSWGSWFGNRPRADQIYDYLMRGGMRPPDAMNRGCGIVLEVTPLSSDQGRTMASGFVARLVDYPRFEDGLAWTYRAARGEAAQQETDANKEASKRRIPSL